MIFLGKKIGMFSKILNESKIVPTTIILCGPCVITRITTNKNSIRIHAAFEKLTKYQKLNKSIFNFFSSLNIIPCRYQYSFLSKKNNDYKVGDLLTVDLLTVGDLLKVSGKTIGKGTAGPIKRHKFKRGPMSHGSKHHRLQGSLGAGTTPSRVFPGKRMSGHLGNTNHTQDNVKLIEKHLDKHFILVKGSIPSKTNNILRIFQNN